MQRKAIDCQLCNAMSLQDYRTANDEAPIKESEVRWCHDWAEMQNMSLADAIVF